MDKDFKRLTGFLVEMGVEEVPHTHKSYLAHLVAVYRDLEAQGCPEDVCRAGMFHSIYGTEKFQGFTLPLARRGEVRALIGDRAERLAYLNCAMDRASFDRAARPAGRPVPDPRPDQRRRGHGVGGGLRRPVSRPPVRLARAGPPLAGMGLSPRRLSQDGRAAGPVRGGRVRADVRAGGDGRASHEGMRRIPRQGRRHHRIPPRTNLQ